MAPDITSVEVTTLQGLISFKTRYANYQSAASDMVIFLFIDSDDNVRTGATWPGIDYVITFLGNAGGAHVTSMTRATGGRHVRVSAPSLRGSYDSFVQTTTVHRDDLGSTDRLAFRIWARREAGSTWPTDAAPSHASSWRITVADSDRDGVADGSDTCPNLAAGRFDANRNGCPGPFTTIGEPEVGYTAVVSAGTTRFRRVVFRSLPRGALLTLRRGSSTEKLLASTTGTATSELLRRHGFPAGSALTLTITRAGVIGYEARLVIQPRRPVITFVGRRCIPAAGDRRPMPCSRVDRGR